MKGIILAGGSGSRLLPLTRVTNKHLLPVGREPMICHPVRKLVEAGITEILVVTGTEHMGAVVSLLGSGAEYGCSFTYRVQDAAGGIAQALGLADRFAAGQTVCVILGDNIFQDSLSPFVEEYRQLQCGAMLLTKKVSDPCRYGVLVKDANTGDAIKVVEKPKEVVSTQAVTGIYFYDYMVFTYIRRLRPSARGELEITDVNNAYIKDGTLVHRELDGWWTDAGTHESLRLANELVLLQNADAATMPIGYILPPDGPQKIKDLPVGHVGHTLAASVDLDKNGAAWIWIEGSLFKEDSVFAEMEVRKTRDGFSIVIPKGKQWKIGSKERWKSQSFEFAPVVEIIEAP